MSVPSNANDVQPTIIQPDTPPMAPLKRYMTAPMYAAEETNMADPFVTLAPSTAAEGRTKPNLGPLIMPDTPTPITIVDHSISLPAAPPPLATPSGLHAEPIPVAPSSTITSADATKMLGCDHGIDGEALLSPTLEVMTNPMALEPSHTRTESTSSVRRPIPTANDIFPQQTRSRRGSASDTFDRSSKPTGLQIPNRPGYGRAASSSDLRSGLASPRIPQGAVDSLVAAVHASFPDSRLTVTNADDPLSLVTLRAGPSRKAFEVHKHLLTTETTYFREVFAAMDEQGSFNHLTPEVAERIRSTEDSTTFEDIDEYGMALFVRWAYGGKLHGPGDFRTFGHYLSLYVLARRLGSEALENNVMDVTRAYYRQHSMTAPAYRLEYIYTMTISPNHMRNFLVTTAAYRCLCEASVMPGQHISDSMKALLAMGGDFAIEFAESCIKLSKNGIVDVRRSSDCTFHEHSDGHFCQKATREPYMNE